MTPASIVPLLSPLPSSTTPRIPDLAEETKRNVEKIRLHFSKDGFELPTHEGSVEQAALSDSEMMFLVSDLISGRSYRLLISVVVGDDAEVSEMFQVELND